MAVEIFGDALHEMYSDPEGPVAEIVERALVRVESTVKVLLMIPGSGREYKPGSYFFQRDGKVYHWVRELPTHRASAPGEPPSSDSGRLMTAVTHRLVPGEVISGEVIANVEYALWLEEGTRYMAPRPFLKPALATLNQ